MTRPTLTVFVEHKIVSRMAVSGAVTLGRLDDNSLVLEDHSVSGHHGRIERGSEGWRYTDMGSSNGSLIAAGPRLSQGEHFLMAEVTQILLGSTVIEFDPKEEGDEPTEQAQPNKAAKPSGGTSVSFDGPVSAETQRRGTGNSAEEDTPTAERDSVRRVPRTGTAFEFGSAGNAPQTSAAHVDGPMGHAPAPHGPSSGQPLADHAHQQPPARPVKPAQLGDLTPATPTPPPSARSSVPPTHPVLDESAQAPESTVAKPRVLVVLHGNVTTVELPALVNVLGRSHRCDVVIDDASISSRHAEISQQNGRWVVRDLGSTNGTRLGLARLLEPHELPNPGHFIMGVADLLFVADDTTERDSEQLDDERFVAWLRRRGKVSRAEAKAALGAAQSRGQSVSEVLVAQGVLSPGALTELHHNAALNPNARSKTAAYLWGAAFVLALAAALFALTR